MAFKFKNASVSFADQSVIDETYSLKEVLAMFPTMQLQTLRNWVKLGIPAGRGLPRTPLKHTLHGNKIRIYKSEFEAYETDETVEPVAEVEASDEVAETPKEKRSRLKAEKKAAKLAEQATSEGS